MPNTATQDFTFVSEPAPQPLVITSPIPPHAFVGVPYSHQFTAQGGVPPYAWSLTTDLAGLTLDPVTGLLSGMTTSSFSVPDTVKVTDSAP